MKLTVNDFSTDIRLLADEVKHLCKPGTDDCCIWLYTDAKGFGCFYYDKPFTLVERFREGKTNAKRDGCNFLRLLDFDSLNMGDNVISIT